MEGKKITRPVFNNPFLNITETPDGSIRRDPEPRNPANSDLGGASHVISKDVTLDAIKKTWLRLYLPREAIKEAPEEPAKLPLIVYYHGGGFIFCSADSSIYDDFCKGLVEKIGGMVISLDYRLAPEHHLPAAYEDAMDGLNWIKDTDDKWVRDYADLNNCYLCGTSAGGNLAYNAGLLAASIAKDLAPLKIKGMILHHPYFSGTKRTRSEERLANDSLLPLYAIDQMFDLCLPKGANRDHEFCNPLINGGSKNIDQMITLDWSVLVTGCHDDPLVEAGIKCADMLEAKGVRTVRFLSDGYHAMEVFDPTMSGPLFAAIKNFLAVW